MRFIRQDTHKKKRLKQRWRAPKGIQSKQRLSKRGYPKKVKAGYGTPNEKELPLVHNLQELKAVEGDKAVLVRTVGKRKTAELLEVAKKQNITFTNLKKDTLETIQKDLKERKSRKKEKASKKQPEKEEKKKDKSQEKSEEEKKKETKKEKDKILTKKGAQ